MVHGEVLVGDERMPIDAVGERDHSWGVRDWWAFPWCWTAGRLDDGTAFHASRPVIDGLQFHPGFVLAPGGALEYVDRFDIDTDLGDDDLPVAARMGLGRLDLTVDVAHTAPVPLVAPDGRIGRFPRSLCRFTTADGTAGVGWTEWNQPPPPPS
jgi:hypothetical protein